MVDTSNKVIIDSPETVKALEYAKELYGTFIPGTLSWLDPSNNKAFLDGQISVTNNGISIYYAAKNSQDPKIKELAADINHAEYPVGPVGVKTAGQLFLNQMIFKYTKYPKAAKEFIRFMMEEEQYGPWMQASIGYTAHPLSAYKTNTIWTVDPKHTPYRDVLREHAAGGLRGQAGLRVGRRARRLHHRRHGRRGGVGPEHAEGSGGAGAEAGRALLQGMTSALPTPCLRRFEPSRSDATVDSRGAGGVCNLIPGVVALTGSRVGQASGTAARGDARTSIR